MCSTCGVNTHFRLTYFTNIAAISAARSHNWLYLQLSEMNNKTLTFRIYSLGLFTDKSSTKVSRNAFQYKFVSSMRVAGTFGLFAPNVSSISPPASSHHFRNWINNKKIGGTRIYGSNEVLKVTIFSNSV